MFNGLLQPTHLILILVVVLIVFGPGKLPEAGKALGKSLKDMRNAFTSTDDDEKKDKSEAVSAAANTAANPTAPGAAPGSAVN
ncbi:MAG TPA: twin-arginine translocase TatA/TatE family subunit [Desulfotomaculum sp.]|nr:twin-arginine translocase TatA/TatE family subunit [Desulfotomaculum sp.]